MFIANEDVEARNSVFNYLGAIVDDINQHICNEYDRREIRNMLQAIVRISELQGKQRLCTVGKATWLNKKLSAKCFG